MLTLDTIRQELAAYDGPPVRLMEVCGTHTASIMKNGIPSLLSGKIRLISGPGCPVCVTVTAYIDRLIELAKEPDHVVLCFGDLLRVRGSRISLSDARAEGAKVRMIYSPFEALSLCRENPALQVVVAAIGFETTAPVYAALLEEAIELKLENLKLLTSLKTMPEVIRWVVRESRAEGRITGFPAPGHVCAITGYREYEELAKETGLPFVVSGFEGEELLCSIYALVRMQGQGEARNLYPRVVSYEGNTAAKAAVEKYFEVCDASWRGMGAIPGSGIALREAYAAFDAGSRALQEDHMAAGCRCADVLTGRITPEECPLFKKVCTPANPHGACMVSQEGSCFNSAIYNR
ncbi:MAG: hydrogenase formation protein HypD [Lachnospiraceae bacterium]|nr:hydrogenase formation protein HypD [Lachnospiraceae bacterium]